MFYPEATAERCTAALLGLSTRGGEAPPLREVLRVAEQGEGWGLPAEWD